MNNSISDVFNVLTKYETESPDKEKKFWEQIEEFKIPLGDILDESKF